MRVVIDCNILVSCLSSRSPYHKIYTSLTSGRYHLIVTQDILLEYEEILQQKYGLATTEAFMALISLMPNVHFVHPFFKWNLIAADPDDNKYCDCAVSGVADFIVSEDTHFNVLKNMPFPPLKIMGIKDFLSLL